MIDRGFDIGFHTGIGGNRGTSPNSIDDFMRELNDAGIKFFLKSADDFGPILDALTKFWPADGGAHTLVFRLAADIMGHNFDVPNYDLSPAVAAAEHWQAILAYLPPEFKYDARAREHVWLEVVNEVDKNRAEWLADFGIEIAKLAISQGFKIAMFSWSSGEPEPAHWRGPKMRAFLEFASANREKVAVAVHEYSFSDDLFAGYPWLVGRYEDLLDACDEFAINPRPYVLITEFGWQAFSVPGTSVGMPDIKEAASNLYFDPEVLGAAIWFLGGGWNSIANDAQKYIGPVRDYALEFDYWRDDDVEPPPPPPPPGGECDFDDGFTKYHILRPRNLSAAQWEYIGDLMDNGLARSKLGLQAGTPDPVVVGYEGWSHVDAILAIKRALEAGYTDSRLIIVDGHQIGTGLDAAWMVQNCPLVAQYTIFLRSDGQLPSQFAYAAWPTEYKHVTQKWGNNPEYYSQFGLPGHEGVDIRAYAGSKIFAPADGFISDLHLVDDGHNYGIFVRIQHADSYETTLCHLDSVAPFIISGGVGTRVQAGQVVGYADDTGNSSGSHLHLTLKRKGYGYADEYSSPTVWPGNIHDPTPYLKPLCPSCFETAPPPVVNSVKLGLHASADPGLAAGELAMMQQAKVEVIKLLSNMRREDVSALSNAFPGIPFIVRAFLDFGGRNVTPSNFIDWTWPDVSDIVNRLGGASREIWVELHNEPNLTTEGLGTSWASGTAFYSWLSEVLRLYRASGLPVKYLYPGLSPGFSVAGLRQDSLSFLRDSAAVASACDGVAMHNYWTATSDFSMDRALIQLDNHIALVPSKTIWVTEASNNRQASQEQKASEYITYAGELAKRAGVAGVTYFIASASNPAWGWGAGGSGEIWLGTSIPSIVGSR